MLTVSTIAADDFMVRQRPMLEVKPLGGLHEIRSSKMHERGHTYYGTKCPDRCALVAKWAARRLITPRTFLLSARTSQNLDDMAALLSVTPADVCAYLSALDADEWLIMQTMIGRPLTCRI